MTRIPKLKTAENSLQEFCIGIGVNLTNEELAQSNVTQINMNEDKNYFTFIFNDSYEISFALVNEVSGDIAIIAYIYPEIPEKEIYFDIYTQTIVIDGKKRLVLYTEETKDVDSETEIHISKLFEEIIKTF